MSGGSRPLYRFALRVFAWLPEAVRDRVVRIIVPSFSVGTSPFVSRADGRVLLVRHSYKKGWGTPGGFLDRGEAAEVGAAREVWEETGLRVELVGEPTVHIDPEGRRVEYVTRARPVPECDPDSARPTSPEIVEVGWFEPDDLPELQDHTAEALLALLRSEIGRHPLS
jgi:8-oxo-dGTP diphosphatase